MRQKNPPVFSATTTFVKDLGIVLSAAARKTGQLALFAAESNSSVLPRTAGRERMTRVSAGCGSTWVWTSGILIEEQAAICVVRENQM